jgi:hypothetical protein
VRTWIRSGRALHAILVRTRRVLAYFLDLACVALACVGAVWMMRRTGWTVPISFGMLYWGGFLVSLLLFGATPGMYFMRLRVRETGPHALLVLRCVLRVAASYALLVVIPACASSLAAMLFPGAPPSISFGIEIGFFIAGMLTSVFSTMSIQDVLSGTTVSPRQTDDPGAAAVQKDYQAIRVFCGLGLVVGAWVAIAGSYAYRLVPLNFEGFFSSVRMFDPSSFLSAQLGNLGGAVAVRQRAGSSFFKPLTSPGPSLVVEFPVSPNTIDDTGERLRAVTTVLRSLSFLEWAKLIKGNTADVTVVTEWRYGFAVYQMRYSYVGAWCLTTCGTEDVFADGGLTEGAEKLVRESARPRSTGGWDVSNLCLSRVPFRDVKAKQQGSVTWVGTPPRIDQEDYPTFGLFREEY